MTVTSINRPQSDPPPTPTRRRSPGRRPTRQIAELRALATDADRIRYACKHMPGKPTTDAVRAWLADREIETERVHTSRTVNKWLRLQGESPTPSGGIPIIDTPPATAPVTPPVTPPVTDDADPTDPVDLELSTDPAPVMPPVVAPVAAPVALAPAPPVVAVEVTASVTPPATAPVTAPVAPAALQRLSHLLVWPAVVVLSVVGVASFVLSYESLQSEASEFFGGDNFGRAIAYGFPLALDLFIVGASLAYLAGAVVGRALPGWRVAAHAAIGGTVVLNATAGDSPVGVLFHIVGPISFAVIVELAAKQLLLLYRLAVAPTERDPIPLTLWLTSPIEQSATWLYMRRRGIGSAIAARAARSTEAGAVEMLEMAYPGGQGRQVLRSVRRQLRSRAVTPDMVMVEAMAAMDARQMTPAQETHRRILAASIVAATTTKGAAATT